MFGRRLVRAFEEVKHRFDPAGLFNPGKIVRAPKFDDRAKFRYPPGYRVGGKTGTAEVPGAGGYKRNQNVSTFAAAFPMRAAVPVRVTMHVLSPNEHLTIYHKD